MMPLVTALVAVSMVSPLEAGIRPRVPSSAPLEYISPVPESRYHRPEATIIVRPGGAIDSRAKLDGRLVTVRGSLSGDHAGRLSESDDGETLIFEPFEPFVWGEEVTWRLGGGLRTDARGPIRPRDFTFLIMDDPGSSSRVIATNALEAELAGTAIADPLEFGSPTRASGAPGTRATAAALPTLTPLAQGPHSPGYFFLSDFHLSDLGHKSHLMIADDAGVVIASREATGRALDFKLQPNGWMTYFDSATESYLALNSNFDEVDRFRCGNGYTTDLHELQLLPNGHALLMSYDVQPIDMSGVAPGGRERALVVGLIIQELDREKRVVYQWRSWDHFQITDATHRDFTAEVIDYAHGNAIEMDVDGNLLVSSRHMDEITKISRRTGEVVWRWGGKNNQFTFVNDPIGFSYQHDARRIANGNVTLFDNGFFHSPPFSRAVEYRLDEERMTATLVWEYRLPPPSVSFAMGSVQRLESGNTVIGWGSLFGQTVTEVTPAGEVVAGLALEAPLVSYRSFRFEWPPAGARATAPETETVDRQPRKFRIVRVSGAGALPVQVRIADGASREHLVSVFDMNGRLVRRWSARPDTQGTLSWDGTRTSGGVCPSGVYFLRVETARASAALKVVITR